MLLSGDDELAGGRGRDLLLAQDFSPAGTVTGPLVIDLAAGQASSFFGLDSLNGIEDVQADWDTGDAVTITGTGGSNELESLGFTSNDTISGRAGDDEIKSGRGADTVLGGPGDDVIHAGQGNDTLDGGPGTDALHGGPGMDTCTNGESVFMCP